MACKTQNIDCVALCAKAGWPLSMNSFVELRRDGKLILERTDVREHSKGSDKSCSKETTFVEPVISQTWLLSCLLPEHTEAAFGTLCTERVTNLAWHSSPFKFGFNLPLQAPALIMTLKASHQLPVPAAPVISLLWNLPHAVPHTPPSSSDAIPLISPDKCHLLWELITLPSEVPVLGGNLGSHFLCSVTVSWMWGQMQSGTEDRGKTF